MISGIAERALFYDKSVALDDRATKNNVVKTLHQDGVVFLKYDKNEYYLVDVNVANKLHAAGKASDLLRSFIRVFTRNARDNKLKASSSIDKDNFIPASDHNYALVDKFMKPVGDMLFDTLDDVAAAIGRQFLEESAVDRILNGENPRDVLQ